MQPPRRVLVVDDSVVVRTAVTRRLRAAALGVVVVEAGSVAEAKALTDERYDAALLDFELPDGTGAAIAAHLEAHRRTLRVAFFTSVTGEARASIERLGRCFHKPDELDDAVTWVLESLPNA